jgi:hypothetical protein
MSVNYEDTELSASSFPAFECFPCVFKYSSTSVLDYVNGIFGFFIGLPMASSPLLSCSRNLNVAETNNIGKSSNSSGLVALGTYIFMLAKRFQLRIVAKPYCVF